MSINAMVEELREQGVEDNFLSVGRFLSRTKWKKMCEGKFPIEDPIKRYTMAIMCEQEHRWLSRMDETTRTINIGNFDKYAFPLIRSVFPELIANDLVSVQPMMGPTSQVFYQDFIYDSNKGRVRRGDIAISSVARGPKNPNYASPQVDGEQIGVGPTNSYAGVALAWTPIVPGSVVITDGEQYVTDDTLGNLIGEVGATPGTIDYATGTLVGGTALFAAAPSNGSIVEVAYVYDAEANQKVPEMSMMITSSTITARRIALKTMWSLDAAFSMHALHGIEAEMESTAGAAGELRFEIDRLIIDDLIRIAGAGSVYWNSSQPSGVSLTEHNISFLQALQSLSNRIHKLSGRGRATWILCGENVATVLETLPGYVETADPAAGMMKGAYRAGRLGSKFDVFKDPFMDDDTFLIGFKGPMYSQAGYVYAPWIPLYATPTLVLGDFTAQKGLATHFGKKPINGLCYATGQIASKESLASKLGVQAADVPVYGHGKRGQFGVFI